MTIPTPATQATLPPAIGVGFLSLSMLSAKMTPTATSRIHAFSSETSTVLFLYP